MEVIIVMAKEEEEEEKKITIIKPENKKLIRVILNIYQLKKKKLQKQK